MSPLRTLANRYPLFCAAICALGVLCAMSVVVVLWGSDQETSKAADEVAQSTIEAPTATSTLQGPTQVASSDGSDNSIQWEPVEAPVSSGQGQAISSDGMPQPSPTARRVGPIQTPLIEPTLTPARGSGPVNGEPSNRVQTPGDFVASQEGPVEIENPRELVSAPPASGSNPPQEAIPPTATTTGIVEPPVAPTMVPRVGNTPAAAALLPTFTATARTSATPTSTATTVPTATATSAQNSVPMEMRLLATSTTTPALPEATGTATTLPTSTSQANPPTGTAMPSMTGVSAPTSTPEPETAMTPGSTAESDRAREP